MLLNLSSIEGYILSLPNRYEYISRSAAAKCNTHKTARAKKQQLKISLPPFPSPPSSSPQRPIDQTTWTFTNIGLLILSIDSRTASVVHACVNRDQTQWPRKSNTCELELGARGRGGGRTTARAKWVGAELFTWSVTSASGVSSSSVWHRSCTQRYSLSYAASWCWLSCSSSSNLISEEGEEKQKQQQQNTRPACVQQQ